MAGYFENLKLVRRSYRKEKFYSLSVADHSLRFLSFLMTPFFLMMSFSPNGVTYLNGFLTVLAALIVAKGGQVFYIAGLVVYLVSKVIDRVDGNIARVKGGSTFYGKFMDGFIDTIGLSLLRLALGFHLFLRGDPALLIWLAVFSSLLTPYQHLIYDRYSAYIRWINEEKGEALKPYIRSNLPQPVLNVMDDLQYLTLFVAVFLFEPGLYIYFIVSIFESLFYVIKHCQATFQNMQFSKVSPKLAEDFKINDQDTSTGGTHNG